MSEKITLDKKKALDGFFNCYAGDISGELHYMNREELLKYLQNDMFVILASATTGIPEEDFRQYAPYFFGV